MNKGNIYTYSYKFRTIYYVLFVINRISKINNNTLLSKNNNLAYNNFYIPVFKTIQPGRFNHSLFLPSLYHLSGVITVLSAYRPR